MSKKVNKLNNLCKLSNLAVYAFWSVYIFESASIISIASLLERPALYLGNSSVENISAFMQGVFYASKNEPDPVYTGFSEWVKARYECDLAVGWPYVVTHQKAEKDGALELTRTLWREYQDARKGFANVP